MGLPPPPQSFPTPTQSALGSVGWWRSLLTFTQHNQKAADQCQLSLILPASNAPSQPHQLGWPKGSTPKGTPSSPAPPLSALGKTGFEKRQMPWMEHRVLPFACFLEGVDGCKVIVFPVLQIRKKLVTSSLEPVWTCLQTSARRFWGHALTSQCSRLGRESCQTGSGIQDFLQRHWARQVAYVISPPPPPPPPFAHLHKPLFNLRSLLEHAFTS